MTRKFEEIPRNVMIMFDKMDALRADHDAAMLAHDDKVAMRLLKQIVELAAEIDSVRSNLGNR